MTEIVVKRRKWWEKQRCFSSIIHELTINVTCVTGKFRHNSGNDIFEGNQDMLKERGKYRINNKFITVFSVHSV